MASAKSELVQASGQFATFFVADLFRPCGQDAVSRSTPGVRFRFAIDPPLLMWHFIPRPAFKFPAVS